MWSLWQSPTWYSCLQSLLSLVVFPHWSNTGIYLPEDHRWLTLAHRSEYNLLSMILTPSPIFIITLSSTSLKPWTLTTSSYICQMSVNTLSSFTHMMFSSPANPFLCTHHTADAKTSFNFQNKPDLPVKDFSTLPASDWIILIPNSCSSLSSLSMPYIFQLLSNEVGPCDFFWSKSHE